MRNLLLLAAGFLTACGHTIYPITSGSHARIPEPSGRYVVWSNHPGVGQFITSLILADGKTVVERSRLDAIFREQRVILSHTTEADVLRVGRLAGAAQVIFADVTLPAKSLWGANGGVTVLVRSVAVESATVLWAGSAQYAEPTVNPDHSAVTLAYWAIARAICPVEAGAVWQDLSAKGGGCVQPKTAVTKTGKPDPTIWGELRGQEITKEYEWLNAEKRALDQQHAALQSEKDPALQRRAFAEYNRRLAEYNKRLAVYEQQRATGQATGR